MESKTICTYKYEEKHAVLWVPSFGRRCYKIYCFSRSCKFPWAGRLRTGGRRHLGGCVCSILACTVCIKVCVLGVKGSAPGTGHPLFTNLHKLYSWLEGLHLPILWAFTLGREKLWPAPTPLNPLRLTSSLLSHWQLLLGKLITSLMCNFICTINKMSCRLTTALNQTKWFPIS